MQIRYDCPNDECVAIIEYEPLEECSGAIECPRCAQQSLMNTTETVRNCNMMDCCAVCGCRELFVRKDFPRRLGLLIVIIFGAAAIYYLSISVVIAWAILTGAALLDLLIYLVIGRVTTCYACRAEYRKCNLNPGLEGFDLAMSEKY